LEAGKCRLVPAVRPVTSRHAAVVNSTGEGQDAAGWDVAIQHAGVATPLDANFRIAVTRQFNEPE
jgi:hypothetical protein